MHEICLVSQDETSDVFVTPAHDVSWEQIAMALYDAHRIAARNAMLGDELANPLWSEYDAV